MKIAFLTLSVLFVVQSELSRAICPQDTIFTEKGCITDCKSEKFVNCQKFKASKFGPNVCALNRSGKWNGFNNECQACLVHGNLGVKQGQCYEPTATGKTAVSGKKAINCGKNRPTERSCPQRQYFAPPQLNICGLTFNRKKKLFDLPCSACKDQTIEFYYNQKCENLVSEQESSIPHVSNEHLQNHCTKEKHCANWQFCLNKKCTDRCALMKCASGGCIRGQCNNGL